MTLLKALLKTENLLAAAGGLADACIMSVTHIDG